MGAFRAETVKASDYNVEYYVDEGEAFYGNYNGLSFFNSNSNKNMHHFMKQLGFPTNYNYFSVWHNYTSPSADSFFSVGSISSREELDTYRKDGADSVGTGLKFYSNENALPLAFAADKGAFDFDFYRLEKDVDEKDYFSFQNDWYCSMFPDQFTDGFYREIDKDVTGEPVIINGAAFNIYDYSTHRYIISKERQSEDSESVEDIHEDSSVLEYSSYDTLGLERTVQNELKKKITDLYRTNENVPIIIEYDFKAPSDGDI